MFQGIENTFRHILIPVKFLLLFVVDDDDFKLIRLFMGKGNIIGTFRSFSNKLQVQCMILQDQSQAKLPRLYLAGLLVKGCPPLLTWWAVWSELHSKDPRTDTP